MLASPTLRHFECPITLELMTDPVITPAGHTYERAAIERVINSGNPCPQTRNPLALTDLVPNRGLKDAIDSYVEALKTPYDLIAALAFSFGLKEGDIWHGFIVQQTLVAMAGIYINQNGSSFERNVRNGNINYTLKFSSANEVSRLVNHYGNKFAGSILGQGAYAQGVAQIIFDAKILVNSVVPVLGNFSKKSHEDLIGKAINIFGKTKGSLDDDLIIGAKLTKKAGIHDHQCDYGGSRRMKDYSTEFTFRFKTFEGLSGSEKHHNLVNYYNQHYPGFIISHSEQEVAPSGGGLSPFTKSVIIVNTIQLEGQILDDLANVLPLENFTPHIKSKIESCGIM